MVTVDGVARRRASSPAASCAAARTCARTGDIGAFVVVRRLRDRERRAPRRGAVRRRGAALAARAAGACCTQAAQALQSAPAAVPAQIEKLKAELAELRKAQAEANKQGLEAEFSQLAAGATVAPRGRWVVAELAAGADTNAVRDAADRLRGALGTRRRGAGAAERGQAHVPGRGHGRPRRGEDAAAPPSWSRRSRRSPAARAAASRTWRSPAARTRASSPTRSPRRGGCSPKRWAAEPLGKIELAFLILIGAVHHRRRS